MSSKGTTKQIPLTKGKFALVDADDFEYLNQWNWQISGPGHSSYASRHEGKSRVWMHKVVMKTTSMVDHRNGDTLDNRKENLRICTQSENGKNRKLNKNNKSGYKGVSFHKVTQKWAAYIKVNYKFNHLGLFATPEDAARCYDAHAKSRFGEYARLNFPQEVTQ